MASTNGHTTHTNDGAEPTHAPPLDDEPTERPSDRPASDAAERPARAKRGNPRTKWILGAVALVVAVGALIAWLRGLGKESTDDAQLEGHVISVAPRVQGTVARLAVRDNQVVNEGDVLVELDPADFRARVAQARADLLAAQAQLAQARAQLEVTEQTTQATVTQARGGVAQAASTTRQATAGIAQARADVAAAADRLRLAREDQQRAARLLAGGAIARAEYDQRASAVAQAAAQLAAARARLATASTGVANSAGGLEAARGRMAQAETGPEQVGASRAAVGVAEARVAQMQAALDLAELNLSYTVVRAPARGVVSRRTAEVGQTVSPERPLLALVPTDDVWVVANFKETQAGHLRAGQHVRVRIDAYPGRDFAAHVDSIAGASGSRFALLPPDNATGNFVKVVQRIPVLIRFDGRAGVPLRPGMNVVATVFTGR